jgi:hypothetical protein
MVLGLIFVGGAGARLGAQGARHGRARPAARPWSAPTSTPAQERFTFGMPELSDGIDFVAARDGHVRHRRDPAQPRTRDRATSSRQGRRACCRREDFKRIGCRAARHRHRLAARHPARRRRVLAPSPPTRWRRRSRGPERFGKGAIEGVAGPESANNAGAQTSFIPLLTLGIPPNAVMALMVGAMIIHGIVPGPQVMTSAARPVLGHDRLDVDRQPDAGRLNLPLIGSG